MKVKVIHSYQKAHEARGLTVVIDVLRAFSTVCYIFESGAKTVIPVADFEDARALKRKNPHFILMGERDGKPLPDFDFGNSPAQIRYETLLGKTVVLTTTCGTKGIARAVNADEIITGAFVNARAIVSHIKRSKPRVLTLLCTDDRFIDGEDQLCAELIHNHLKGKKSDFEEIKKFIAGHPVSHGFLVEPFTKYAREDFELCMQADRFNFIVKVRREAELIYLDKVVMKKD